LEQGYRNGKPSANAVKRSRFTAVQSCQSAMAGLDCRHHPPMPANISVPHCTAILVAAGSSRRMGTDKLAWPLAGVPVLRRTLDAFLAAQSIAAIVVVCPEERWNSLGWPDFQKPVTRADGGVNRQDSVANGLMALDPHTRYVAVHDGARPLVAPEDIDRCVAAAIEHQAATLASRVTETMQRSDSDDFSAEPVSRDHLWRMETPQVFQTALLRDACAALTAGGLVLTDEVTAVQAAARG